ncbi:hypothetical protein BaRGS_00023407, partial [Batillaria attramentaria]
MLGVCCASLFGQLRQLFTVVWFRSGGRGTHLALASRGHLSASADLRGQSGLDDETTGSDGHVPPEADKRNVWSGVHGVGQAVPDYRSVSEQRVCLSQWYDHKLCAVSADPHVRSYQEARADVNLPCQYRLTRFLTDFPTSSARFSYCSVEVYVSNVLHKDHYYVHSVHIIVGVTDLGKQVHNHFELRKYGVSDDQIYEAKVGSLTTKLKRSVGQCGATKDRAVRSVGQGRARFKELVVRLTVGNMTSSAEETYMTNMTKVRTVWGFSDHDSINGVDIFPTYDSDNNFAVLTVPMCDVRIKYRAFDRNSEHQHLLPGITVMAPPHSQFVPEYGDYPASLCGQFSDTSSLYEDRARLLGLKSADLAVIYDVLKQQAPQTNNPMGSQCEAAMDAFAMSSNKAADMNSCGPILTVKSTRRCVVDQELQPIVVFTACLRYRKNRNPLDCQLLKAIRERCGHRMWQELSKAIDSLSCGKAPGKDGISPEVLKSGANFQGLISGVAQRITKKVSAALSVHCLAHGVNLAVQETVRKVKVIRGALDCATEVIQLITASPKRQVLFENIQIQANEKLPGIRPFCPTGWTVRASTMHSLLQNYSVLQETFEVVFEGSDDYARRASGLLVLMQKFSTFFGLTLSLAIFAVTENLSCSLQSKQTTCEGATKAAELGLTNLNKQRSDEAFSRFFEEARKKADANQ